MTQHFLPAILLCAVFLVGCASKPAMPNEQVLATPTATQALQIPSEPLRNPAEPMRIPAEPLRTPSEPLRIPAEPLRVPGEPLQSITPGQIGGFKIAHAEPPKELWDRIRRGFAMPDLQDTLVTDREQW